MYIERLKLSAFRNLRSLDLSLSPRTVLVRGNNAQGKTNLLEALYVCATGRSFRSGSPGEMIQRGESRASAEASFVRQGVRHAVEVVLEPGRRKIRIDDKALSRASRLLTLVNVIAFFPDDLRIVKGSPEERRRFLDRMVANQRPELVDVTLKYLRVLRSRNSLLRRGGVLDPKLLDTYDEQLVSFGVELHRHRSEGLADVAPVAAEIFAEIMPRTSLRLTLLPGLARGDQDSFAEAFRDGLKARRQVDRQRGMTTLGPHRADVRFDIDDIDARTYASQGQQRTAVLALKLAEVRRLRERLDSAPILLLDDVSSELDAERTSLLFDAIRGMEGQVWVSTTGAADLPVTEESQVLAIDQGRVQPHTG